MALNKIQKFIKDNGLDFTGSGSDLNSNFCILSGYALYLGLTLKELKDEMNTEILDDAEQELERVFNFAENHDYGAWWKTYDAGLQYKF
jgi:hypothetical protein